MFKTCRTCLLEIPDTTYINLNGNDVKSRSVRAELLACIPELQVGLVKDPVMCRNCLNILQLVHSFKTRCLLSEKRIQSCIRNAKLNGKPITLTKLFRFSKENKRAKNCSTINGPVARDSDNLNSDPNAVEPGKASLHIEADDYITSTENEDSNVVTDSDVSTVDGEDENDLQSITTSSEANMGLTVQPLEFRDKILGWSSATTCNDSAAELSQDFQNEIDDHFVKEEHELLPFKTETDESSSLKTEVTNDEERSNYYKTVNRSEVSNIIDGDVKEETLNITDDAVGNNLIDGGYEFPGDNDKQRTTIHYIGFTANEDSNVVMGSEGSLVDRKDESERWNFVTNSGAITELTLQALEFHENSSGSSSTPTAIMGEISQDVHNAIDDDIIKQEHELLPFKIETAEAFSFKEESSNVEEESSNDCKVGNWDDIKEETRSITDDADGKLVDNEVYEFLAATRDSENFEANSKSVSVRQLSTNSNYSCDLYSACTTSSDANITEQHISSVKKRKVHYEHNNCRTLSLHKGNNAYTFSSNENSQEMSDTYADNQTKQEHEMETHEKKFKACTVDVGFSIKMCFVNLQRLNLSDLLHKSSFNAKELLNLTSAKSLQTTDKKPETVRHIESKNLSKHEQAHSTKKSFCCTVCKYSTTLRKNLVTHMRIHKSQKPFHCYVCGLRITRKQSLIKHMRIHTGDKPFQCIICEYSAVRKQSLIIHMNTHTGEKPFQCNVCDHRTVHKQNLINHMRTHTGEKPFQCNVCDYRAIHKQHLTTHMRTHTGEKPFQCNVCDYRTIYIQNLSRHMLTHTVEKPFQCNVCEYSAVEKRSLIRHMRSHSGEKPFQCKVCEYSAVQKESLIEHMRTHTGEKPFQCNVCEYSAVEKRSLIRHMRTHTGEKPFQCKVCEYSAIQKQSLIKHMRTHVGRV